MPYQKNIVLLQREFKNEVKKIFYILAIKFNSQITFIYKQQKLCHYGKFY